jgi:hypothetical protein
MKKIILVQCSPFINEMLYSSFQRTTEKRISMETKKETILVFSLFKVKLVVVEFPTIFVIKFLSGMSLPPKLNGNSSFCKSKDPIFGGNASLLLWVLRGK